MATKQAARSTASSVHGDVIAAIEAAYTPNSEDAAWLEQLLRSICQLSFASRGAFGYFYELGDGGEARIWDPTTFNLPDEYKTYVEMATSQTSLAWADAVFRYSSQCTTASSLLGSAGSRFRFDEGMVSSAAPLNEAMTARGVKDFFALRVEDTSRRGIMLTVPLFATWTVPRQEVKTWVRVAAHVAAGLRLRRRPDVKPDDADAVLSPSGRVEHARVGAQSPAAHEELSRAARTIDKARSRIRSKSELAVESWRALVAGKWSLVDHFDHDGRRYLVARENTPPTRQPLNSPLSQREQQVVSLAALGHSNKLIAYELGIAPSTGGGYLRTAALKLGAASRVALIRACANAVGDAAMTRRGLKCRRGPRRDLVPVSPPADLDVRFLTAGDSTIAVFSFPLPLPPLPASLSNAERAVVIGVLGGMSNAQIARRRSRAVRTIANQVSSILRKLGVGSRGELASLLLTASPAYRRGA